MNHGKGFPLPRYGNNTDSWVPVTGIAPENRKRSIGSYTAAMLGGPIPAMESESWTPVTGIPPENRKRSIGSYTSAMLGGPIPAMESEPWTPVTPEKPISQKPNEVGNENWGDLIGMYGHVLREETLDLNVAQDPYTPIPQSTVLQNRVVASRNLNTILNSNPIPKQNHESNRVSNPVSFFPVEDPANWSGSSLSALVRPNSASTSIPFINRPQNNGVHGLNLNTTPVSNSSTQVQRPNLGSILRNQQSLMESLKKSENPIVAQRPSMGGYNSNPLPTERFPVPYRPSYNLNSPPRSEVDSGVPFAPITPDTERTQVTNQWVPVKDRHEIQRIENENTDTHENEVLQNINESTSSAVSTTHKENVVFEEGGDELGIDLNKTPQQKTPARRKKHRPKVIREGKKPRKNVKSTTPDETRVKRKYVRKNIVDKVQESVTPDGVHVKRKYVRKTGINTETKANVNEATVSVVETPVKSCKKKLNFDLESVAADESQTGSQRGGDGSGGGGGGGGGGGINLNVNPQDIEQERRINNILERTSMKVSQNINVNDPSTPIVITRDDALNVLARRLMVKGTREQMLRTGFIRMGQPVPGQTMINIDERRGVKRQICHQIHPSNLDAMKNLLTYQQFMTNQKRAKTENAPEPRRTNEGVYGNVPAMQLLNACQMNAAVKQNLQKHPEASGMQERLTEREPRRTVNAPEPYQRFMSERNQVGYSHRVNPVTTMVSWNRPPATPPKDYYKSGLVTYPGTLLDKRTIPPNTPNQSQSQRSNGADEMLLQLRKVAPEVPVKKPRGAPRKQKVAGAVAVLFSVEDITCRLEGLSIYDEGEKERNALVPYRGNNAIVPFEPIKKRKPRPKVDLDPETDRLWRLLMGKEGSEANETLDKDKEKWWEEERRVFRGRADSFIARMHLVQGDRRFSRWKGSVVDSVIGVFLTQNVSDHLSSSAFMSLAAKFSHQPTKTNERCCQKETRIIIEEPTETLSPVTNKHNRASDSVILSQDSLDSSMIQTVDELRSSSGSNSEAEDQTTGFESSKDPSFRSQTEKVNMFKELFSQENRTPQQYIHNLPKTPSIAFGLLGGESISSLPSSKSGISFQQNETPPGKYNFLGGEDRGSAVNKQNYVENLAAEANSKDPNGNSASHEPYNGAATKIMRERKGAIEEEKKKSSDWDKLRRDVFLTCEKKERSVDAKDSLDYEALRRAHVNQISDAIRERGMNNLLADRIKDFLDRLVRDHGSIDLEWLRDVPPDKAKEYLLSIRGLGLKSVECVRLLTLHHLAFPVDTNVGRIAVRLGWVPLQPLPESLQLHLLEMYPVLESIQKYLWPRLCKLDQLTLYELHYQMITFGKVFCTKSKPNCNACPMRAECRHFASAFASARLALPGPEEKRIVPSDGTNATQTVPPPPMMNGPGPGPRPMALPPADSRFNERGCEPIIEEPTTPEAETAELSLSDIEDQYYDDDDEIPTIKLDMNEFTMNLQKMQDSMDIQGDMSKALVALNPQAASIPTPKLKNVSRLRTEHQVYELPDSHPILEGLDRREPDDPSPYLLAIWTPGETANSMHPPERGCQAQESGILCDSTTCFSCNCIKEANSQVVRGTILMPCRTATRGSFPLNGTYFQVNEMFADHASSLKPIDVPRAWIWNLPRRTVYFGTSVSTIFKGLTTQEIQQCFWRGFVCVRGFDQKTRAPRPLMARLHFPASKLVNKKDEEK